jgi:DNA helicase-2/ATP-dependent DNA helicase PcrA
MANNVPPRRICAITFTNKAAGELVIRLGLTDETPKELTPRVSTIHSLALNGIRRDPKGFGLQSSVSPLDDYDQRQMLKKIIERIPAAENINVWNLLDKIGFHRARGVGFRVDYTDEVHERALDEHSGYHALDDMELQLWSLFEDEKRKNSAVDFDDMLHLVTRRLREDPKWKAALQRQFDHVLMDEAQDTNPVQWEFVNALLPEENLNMYIVGDMSQCQPPWTKIKLVTKPPKGGRPAECEQRPISEVQDGDLAVAWSKHVQISYSAGRKLRVSSRHYSGPMLRIGAADATTDCTPNHWNWVRFNKNAVGKYAVYLMYRSDLGYRVGVTVFKRSTGNNKRGGYGLSTRFNQEKAEKAWILKVCDTRPDAEAWEEIYSVKYGIPESLFEPAPCFNKTAELIKLVFQHANPVGGLRCLSDHGLLAEHPLLANRAAGFKGASWRGYFKTAAANIIPILMDIPVEGRNKSAMISAVSTYDYDGLVYSLDVEKDHTYIADGLVVGNSIYGFNGALPRLLKEYSESWRGVTPDLYRIARNHRSVPEIVKLANVLQTKMTRTIPLKMESWRGLNGESGLTKMLTACLSEDIAISIASEIKHDAHLKKNPILYKENAILVRASIQIRELEAELVRRRIPYIVRGGRGLLQTEEVRDILAYLRLAANHKDFMALVRAVSVPKRGFGEVALEKLRAKANAEHDGDLVSACRSQAKLSMFLDTIDHISGFTHVPLTALNKVIQLTRYRDYIRDKYKKDPEKVKNKLENIERFIQLVDGLVTGSAMTTEDLVFQLSLDRPKDENDKARIEQRFASGQITQLEREQLLDDLVQGAVVISTIHAAKGLEWKRVYVTNITEGSLPHKFSMGSEEEIEEERRLFYVACTRAKDILVLCLPSLQRNGPNTNNLKPSRFLEEIGVA